MDGWQRSLDESFGAVCLVELDFDLYEYLTDADPYCCYVEGWF
jgi:hypothetical protein